LLPLFAWLILMFGYPIVETLRMAFSSVLADNYTTGDWPFIGLDNFRALPSLDGWDEMVKNTVIFLVGSIVPQVVIGTLLAVALNRRSRFRRLARPLVLLPWLFPQVATATVFGWMFASPTGLAESLMQQLGLSDQPMFFLQTPTTALIVIILLNIWIGIPFNYLVIQSGLQGIPSELHDAALVDGASWMQELTRVTIPLLKETFLTVILLGIMGTMNVFSFVWILTQGGPANATMLPGVLAYKQAFVVFNYGQGAAIIVGVVAILVFTTIGFLVLNSSSERVRTRPRPTPVAATS
jgi:multiple sugar transport system permease protein